MNVEQKDILVRIGVAILLAQSAELLIRLCTTYVLQMDAPLTIDKLERQAKEERRKTLGYFLGGIRKRADLDESFDSLLDTFLEERNLLVHSLSDIPGWNLNTPEGLEIARSFLNRFICKTEEIHKVFLGLVRTWQEQADINVPFPEGTDLFAEIDVSYKARVDDIFFEKSS